MAKQQRSKRARTARKTARWAGLHRNTAHPSHQPGWARWARAYARFTDLLERRQPLTQ